MSLRNLLVVCGGAQSEDSMAVRPDNLATIATFDGFSSVPSKFGSAFSKFFAVSLENLRIKKILSRHLFGTIQKGECSVANEIDVVCANDDYLAAGSKDGLLRIWRLSDGELVIEQQLHIGPITCLRIDSSIWVLYAASSTGRIGAWCIPDLYNAAEPDQMWSLHTLQINDIAVTPGGSRVFSVSNDRLLKCYDFTAGCEILSVSFDTPLTCVALSNNESVVYVGGLNGIIYRLEISQDSHITSELVGHTQSITDLIVSEDDRSVYSTSLDNTVRRWDAATGQTVNQVETKGSPFSLHWIPSEKAQKINESLQTGKPIKDSKGKLLSQKPFPRLKKAVSNTNESLIYALSEETPILTQEEEIRIAIADLSSIQQANAQNTQ